MAKLDSEDELKRQMRRRLVGAVALVTALFIILPMLLQSTPNPREGSLELRIPDKDRAGAFTSQMVVAESAPEVTEPPAAPQEAAQPASAPADAAPSEPPPKSVKSEGGKSGAGKSEPGKSAPAKTEATHKQAKPEPRQADDKVGEHKPGFAVQVGAFSHPDAARDLQERLRKQGWRVYTEKAGGTVRVRVGPYSSRAAAEQALHQLTAQGMQPAIVGEP